MRSLRKLVGLFVPAWLSEGDGGLLTQSLAMMVDISAQRLRSGLEARFPSRAGAEALDLIGRYRLLPRGKSESDASYATRLIGWRYPRGHRIRGNVFALLTQISAYFGGLPTWGIDRSGNRRARDAAGTEAYEYGYSWTWDSGAAAQWARQWIVIDNQAVAEPDATDAYLRWTWPEGATEVSGAVSSWVDTLQSWDWAQSVAGNRPAYGVRGPEFDGTNDYLEYTTWPSTDVNVLHSEATILIAGSRDDDDTATSYVVHTSDQTATQTGINLAFASNSPWFRVLNGSGTPYVNLNWPTSNASGSGNFLLIAGFDSAGAYLVTGDGSREDGTVTGSPSSGNSSHELALNWWGAPWAGTVYEVLIFDRKLTDTEVELWRIHLTAKHGIGHQPLFSEQPDFGDATLWGGTLGTRGYSIGIKDSTAEDWLAIRKLCAGQHRWLPAGTQGEWAVVALDGSAPKPDATYETWGEVVGTDYLPTRARNFRYVVLRDAARECAGDPTAWANDTITPNWTITGDPTQFPTDIGMPDGSTITGDPAIFPATITLPDDGDRPE